MAPAVLAQPEARTIGGKPMIGAGRGISAGIPRPYAERRLMDWAKKMKGARYHEAAHAVAAYHNGYKITGIIATDDEWITNYRGPVFGGWAESWREACVTMAGQLADQRASWGEMRPQPWAEFLAEAEEEREQQEWGDLEDLSDHGRHPRRVLSDRSGRRSAPSLGTLGRGRGRGERPGAGRRPRRPRRGADHRAGWRERRRLLAHGPGP
jgi:hypothetical protein